MNLEERMKMYKESVQVKSKEEKYRKQSVNQKMPFMAEQERTLSYHEFLWTQLRVIQKDGGFFNLCFW